LGVLRVLNQAFDQAVNQAFDRVVSRGVVRVLHQAFDQASNLRQAAIRACLC
jgi:hypothetical protein